MIFALLFTLAAHAATLAEKWNVPIKEGIPLAAFFDAGSASIFVSVSEGRQARVDQFDLTGKPLQTAVVRADGPAGPMRAHFGQIYWAAGSTIWRFDPAKGKKEKISAVSGTISDFTVGRDGTVYVGLSDGKLLEISKNPVVRVEGQKIAGLFLLDTDLYIVRPNELESFSLRTQKRSQEKFCDCLGLEKSSGGAWITAEGKKLRSIKGKSNRVLLEVNEAIGRFAYKYSRDPKDDLVIIPLAFSKTLRAYSFP